MPLAHEAKHAWRRMTGAETTGAVLLGLGVTHFVYTYVAYPLIVSLLPARSSQGPSGTPRLVSIVIAARRPGRAIAQKVGQLLRTVTTRCEFVAVLDGPDPVAAAALAEL